MVGKDSNVAVLGSPTYISGILHPFSYRLTDLLTVSPINSFVP